ncbi:MAG TPA: hypothetical protein VEJ84_09385 [Acidimicrobiales bacterium]|nr:hypothetical protein [Acidimicrobiales bacterium]
MPVTVRQPVPLRQQVLVLYLSTSSLASKVVGWSLFDGDSPEAEEAGSSPEPPYLTGLDALRDGWRLFQASQLLPPPAGEEYATSFQKFEFFFEKLWPIEPPIDQPPIEQRATSLVGAASL